MPLLTKQDLIHQRDFLLELYGQRPVHKPIERVSEYIEGKRVLPPNTPFPGFWTNDKTPYSIEIMDNLSPASPIQHTVVMKGAQLGLTAAAENILAYWIDEFPAEILFISATDESLKKWATKRLEPLIDSCGFREKLFAQVASKGSRRTGDTTFVKEYVGGTLNMSSAQSPASLRSDSKRILIRDEVDGAPAQLRTGEGNWLDVSYARTNAWGSRRKVLDFSTPTTFEESLINKEYENGDQRKFFIPCPYCHKYQVLTWERIRAENKAGILDQVYYLCEFCEEAFFNHHKTALFAKGKWEPTATAHSKFFRSYHISSLYSAVGMLTWFEMYEMFNKAQDDPDGMRSFTNLYLGLPYREKGARPKLQNVIELKGHYRQATVPADVLFLTMGVDVQRGSTSNKLNPARLELEVCGHGAGYRTWSILYKVIEGEVTDPFSGAWEKLNQWVKETGLKFKRFDDTQFPVVLIFIDSGDGNVTDVVYRFCAGWNSTFPIKGFSALKRRKQEVGDEAGPTNFKRYRPVKIGEDGILYEISTNYYKTHLYNNLKIQRQDIPPQRAGFCDFPVDYNEKYFRMLTAEEKRTDGSFHCPSGRANEALDCRVYNLCAGDVYLDSQVLSVKAAYQKQGARADQVQVINHRMVLESLTKATAIKKVVD
jgi:phage terminase large subunit GpA-like protein